jgi:hypothetical protein
MDLDELRSRLTPEESSVLNALLTGPAATGEFQPVETLAAACVQPAGLVVSTLRMLGDLDLVDLREAEQKVRLRAAAVLATRRPRTLIDRFALVGSLWGQLSQGAKRLAKIATGLIGLVVIGQVVGAIQSIVTAIHSLVTWLSK